jgi:hypothetical protein
MEHGSQFIRSIRRGDTQLRTTVRLCAFLCLGAATATSVAAAASDRVQETSSAKPEAAGDIVVTARRTDRTVKIDRTVYDVKTGDDAASLNTVDVLKKVPGIVVDPSNRIIIRGGVDVGYLIDGKPVRRDVALAIAASQISRVEILTNPSVEYDSNGGVLINLVLKKTADTGWGGAISGKADTLGGFKSGLDVTHGGEKWTLDGTVSLRSVPSKTHNYRVATLTDPTAGQVVVTDDVRERSYFNQTSLQLKATDRISDERNLSIMAGTNINSNPHNDSGLETLQEDGGTQAEEYGYVVHFHGIYPYGSIEYEDKKDHDHDFSSSVEAYTGFSKDYRRTMSLVGGISRDHIAYDFIEGKVEYQKNLDAITSVTAGFTTSTNDVTDRVSLSDFSSTPQNGTSDFHLNRMAYALYGFFETPLLGVNLKIGLRVERITQKLKDATGSVPGAKFATRVLPSVHLLKKINKRNSLTASFTLRTEKPDGLYYNPSRRYISPFQLDQGNPFLKLPVKRQAEISHNYEWKYFSFTQTLYYRDTKNGVNPYTFVGGDGLIIYSYANLTAEKVFGYSLTLKKNITRNLQLSYNLDVFHKRLSASPAINVFNIIRYSGVNSSGNIDFKLDKENAFSANVGYVDRTFTLGFRNPATWSTELQYTHTFPSRITLTADLVDFATPQTVTTRFYGPGVNGFERVRRNSQLFRIGLSKAF